MKEKLLTIGETSKLVGLTPRAIRLYEKKGLIKPTAYSEGNYRLYSIQDIVMLQHIKIFKKLDISLEDIQDIMPLLNSDTSEEIINGFKIHKEMLNDKINKLVNIMNAIDQIISTYQCNHHNSSEKILQWIERIVEVMDLNVDEKLKWKDKWNFDKQSNKYDDIVQTRGEIDVHENYAEVLDLVFEKATCPTAIKVLDIGTGTGNLGGKFLAAGHYVLGVDQSEEMLKKAKDKYPQMDVIKGNFLALPCGEKEFDCIVSTYALHHLNEADKKLAFDEMLRVLKDNGKIVIGDLMFLNEEARKQKKQQLLSIGNVEAWEEIEDEYFGDVEEIERYLKEKGMKLQYKRMAEYTYIIWIQGEE